MVTRTAPEPADLAPRAARAARPNWQQVWSALASVADPEIPVLSVIDLGVLRAVEWDVHAPERLCVRITPTYSGCPALDVMRDGIRNALQAAGVADIAIETALAPAWSTDAMTTTGRRKLREYGIAPPGAAPVAVIAPPARWSRPAAEHVACPRCGSSATELLSAFGSTACKAHYRCRDCLEPFDHFKRL